MNMGSFFKIMQSAFKDTIVGTLSLCYKANNLIEKACWLLMGIIGSIVMAILIFDQIHSWSLDPIISSTKRIKLSEVEFPAITVCHQGNTRMEFPERMLKLVDERHPKMRKMRSIFLKNSVEYTMEQMPYDYPQDPKEISYRYSRCKNDDPNFHFKCNFYDIVFGYAKDRNITTEEVYDLIYQDLVSEDDISSGLKKIREKMANASKKYNITAFLSADSSEWKYITRIDTLLEHAPKALLEMPIDFTGFLMKQITEGTREFGYGNFKYDDQWKENDLDELYNLFTLPEGELNLMAISHLYTMNNFEQMGRTDLFSFKNKLYLGGVPQDFQECFKHRYHIHYGTQLKIDYNSFEYNQRKYNFMQPSLCHNISEGGDKCKGYCKWHASLLKGDTIKRKEFLTLMKFSLPQKELKIQPAEQVELNLMRKIFLGNMNYGISNDTLSSMSLVTFCKNRIDQNWLGDDIGMVPKFCTEFFSTPTDQGICMTKNLNFIDSMPINEDFKRSFEFNKGKEPMKIQGNILKAKATYVINTNAKNVITTTFSRSSTLLKGNGLEKLLHRQKEMQEVDFQIHSPYELPQIQDDYTYSDDMHSLRYRSGYEYFIKLTPFGQTVTNQFKKLSYEERKCLLKDEVPDSSALKVYTKQNCRYECKTRYAMNKCKCIPWDFPLNVSNSFNECDVFGRTCFYNAIKYFTTLDENVCPHCLDSCEFITYHRSKLKIDWKKLQYVDLYNWFDDKNQYEDCQPKDFCEYLNDENGTILAKTWYERLTNRLGKEQNRMKKKAVAKLEDLIIVHVSFSSPTVEFNVLDARYNFYHKLSNLGGTLGVCGQITGASFLTLIHLVVLTFKAIYKWHSSYRC